MPISPGSEDARSRPGTLTSVTGPSALAGVVLGLVVNWLSDAVPGVAASAIGGAALLVLVAANKLRRLPPHAPIQRLVSQVSLTGAALATAASVLVTGPLRPWLVLAATALALLACLAPVPGRNIAHQLVGVSGITAGSSFIGQGVSFPPAWGVLLSVVTIGFGLALMGIGFGFLLQSPAPGVAVAIGVGVSSICGGVGILLESHVPVGVSLIGVALIILGVALICAGVSVLLESHVLFAVAYTAAGVALICGGVGCRLDFDAQLGTACIAVGAVCISIGGVQLLHIQLPVWLPVLLGGLGSLGCGVAVMWSSVDGLLHSEPLTDVSQTGMGWAGIFVGLGLLFGSRVLIGIAIGGFGVVTLVSGVLTYLLEKDVLLALAMLLVGLGALRLAMVAWDPRPRLTRWWQALISTPTESPDPGPRGEEQHPSAPDHGS